MTTGFFSDLPRTLAALRSGIDHEPRPLHLGAQLYVSVGGTVKADGAVGDDRPGHPLTPEHLMLWLSATKPVTAVAFGKLWEAGKVGLDDPVMSVIPEFGQGNKERVTFRQLLTHTSGIRMVQLGWPQASWEEVLQKIYGRRLEPRWEPGEKAGYHLGSSWFVLGEAAQRLSGRPFPDFVRQEVFEPLGMEDCFIGMPGDRYEGYEAEGRIAHWWNSTPSEELRPHRWHKEDQVTGVSPGGNGRGPMRQLGRFYEMLLGGGEADGARVLSPQTVEAMTARHRVGLYDHTFKHVMDWGLGFINNSNQYGAETVPYAYGPHASRRAFGHSGYRSTVAFADPKHELVVALAWNGTPSNEDHEARVRATLGALYEDLGLAEAPGEG